MLSTMDPIPKAMCLLELMDIITIIMTVMGITEVIGATMDIKFKQPLPSIPPRVLDLAQHFISALIA